MMNMQEYAWHVFIVLIVSVGGIMVVAATSVVSVFLEKRKKRRWYEDSLKEWADFIDG